MAIKDAINLPEVNFSEEGPIRHLHLGSEWIQGSMLLDAPYVLVHEYIQRMMVGLMFVDPATLGQRQALQLGLGAASLTKFCHKVLRLKNTTAIELNPQVLHACKGWFNLPADNPRMQVVLADASQEIKKQRWQGAIDLLHVDLYDDEAAAPVLDSADFYTDCRNTLTDEGCMTVNLFGRSSSFQNSVDQIAVAFGMDAIWAFKSTREGNTVVMAQRTSSRPNRKLLMERAEMIVRDWGLPADKWVRGFKPVRP